MLDLEVLGPYVVLVVAGAFLLWYFVGAHFTRRRLAEAARWVHRGLPTLCPLGSEGPRASIKWLSTNAFNIALETARPPFSAVVVTVLLRSRDMVTMWLIDRFRRRQDLLMLRFDLERQPIWGVEIYRRRSVLAGDASDLVRASGWAAQSLPNSNLMMIAHGGGQASNLCAELLTTLGAEHRSLVRLSVRRQSPHITLAMDLPDPTTSDPAAVMRLAERLAAVTIKYGTQ
jgi:hypothetical protein